MRRKCWRTMKSCLHLLQSCCDPACGLPTSESNRPGVHRCAALLQCAPKPFPWWWPCGNRTTEHQTGPGGNNKGWPGWHHRCTPALVGVIDSCTEQVCFYELLSLHLTAVRCGRARNASGIVVLLGCCLLATSLCVIPAARCIRFI